MFDLPPGGLAEGPFEGFIGFFESMKRLWTVSVCLAVQVGLVNGSQGRQRLPDGVRGKSVATKATSVRCWEGGKRVTVSRLKRFRVYDILVG